MVAKDVNSIAALFGLEEDAKPIVITENTIEAQDFDADLYQNIYGMSEVMQNNVKKGEAEVQTFPMLSQDIFLSLFKMEPELRPIGEVKGSSKLNHKLMEYLMDTDEYKDLRQYTTVDVIGSAIGSEVMQTRAIEKVVEIRKRQEEQRQQQQQGGQPGQPGQPGGGGIPGIGEPDPTGGAGGGGLSGIDLINEIYQQEKTADAADATQEAINGLIEEMKKKGGDTSDLEKQGANAYMTAETARKIANELAKQAEEELESETSAVGEALRQAAKQAKDEVTEVQQYIQAWGMDGGNPDNRISMQDRRHALERIRRSSKLKKFSELLGRLKEMAIEDLKKKTHDGASAIESVKNGNNIDVVLPSEKMKLASKTTRADFMRRYHQKELLQYELENTEQKGRGPMICCVDTSGSMEGEPDNWAKAVALALLEIAQKQRRNYACILFSGSVAKKDIFIIPFGSFKPDMAIDICERFSGGGTNFEYPLTEALKIMKQNKFSQGDIVFITDGESWLPDDFLKNFLKTKEEKEFRVQTVLINITSSTSDSMVKQFSDSVVTVSDLSQMEKAADQIFLQI